jgi:hypothetical protein
MTDAPFDLIDPMEARVAARVRGWADQAVEPIDSLAVALAAASARSRVGLLGRFHPRDAKRRISIAVRPNGRRTSVLLVALLTLLTALALIGSSLLFVAGQRTTPSPQTIDPLAGFLTKEVEPGVLRIVNDGIRDLSWLPPGGEGNSPNPYRYYRNALGLGSDGSAWFARPDGVFRLGLDEVFAAPGIIHSDLPIGVTSASPGNERQTRLWTLEGTGLTSLDPSSGPDRAVWERDPNSLFVAAGTGNRGLLAIDASSVLWAIAVDGADPYYPPWDLLSSADEVRTWTEHAFPGPAGRVTGLWSTGTVGIVLLLELAEDHSDPEAPPRTGFSEQLWTFDGSTWEHVGETPPATEVAAADVGQDGTLWMRWQVMHWQELPDGGWEGEYTDAEGWARLIDDGWTLWSDPSELPRPAGPHDGGVGYQVGPDGSLWFAPAAPEPDGSECDGLARFDGTTLTRFLQPLCLYNLAIGPDGSVWALAGADYWVEEDPPVETYVIPAEAAMADR